MATRSLNKVMLIGNIARDPELRYTPSGAAVCSFRIATNRSWTPSDGGERKEETEFHRIVAWNKLAELCAQLITKGRKVYIEGRLQTRQWETSEGEKKYTTEIVAEDMVLLDSRRLAEGSDAGQSSAYSEGSEKSQKAAEEVPEKDSDSSLENKEKEKPTKKDDKKGEKDKKDPKKDEKEKEESDEEEKDDIDIDDIPF